MGYHESSYFCCYIDVNALYVHQLDPLYIVEYRCQVRTKLESLDGIVPPTNGFMISSTGMKNVWLSMEHQAILWCNQLVIQVSKALFNLNLTFG